jgi:hypothetical protein
LIALIFLVEIKWFMYCIVVSNHMMPHVLPYDERWLRPDGAVRNWQVLRRECKAKADAGHIPCGHLSIGHRSHEKGIAFVWDVA